LEKEKQKPKSKDRVEAEKETVDVESELSKLEQEVKMEGEQKESDTSTYQQLTGTGILQRGKPQVARPHTLEMPKWTGYPWMYSKPSDPKFVTSWYVDWCDLILKWCQFNVVHIMGLTDFKATEPFDRLPEKESRELLQYIVDRGLGKWIDKDRTAARIMWRSLDEWANDIYEWAYDNGVEMLDIFAIKSAKENFASLPVSDMKDAMEILTKRKLAKWIDKSHEQAKLILQ